MKRVEVVRESAENREEVRIRLGMAYAHLKEVLRVFGTEELEWCWRLDEVLACVERARALVHKAIRRLEE